MIAIVAALYGVSVVFLLLRTVSKALTRTFCVEDHIIIAAMVLAVAPMACVFYSEQLCPHASGFPLPLATCYPQYMSRFFPTLKGLRTATENVEADGVVVFQTVAGLGFGSHVYDLGDGALLKILRLRKSD